MNENMLTIKEKQSLPEESILNVSKEIKGQQLKKLTETNKKLENVEFLLKIEEKNKREVIENYEKQIEKVEKVLFKYENEIKGYIDELNQNDQKIYQIQKMKFDNFKVEITKYDNIYKDLEEKSNILTLHINDSFKQEHHSYNRTFIINEDLLSFKNEINQNKLKILNLKNTMINIEKSYPKEFEFLLEDIKYEKELNQVRIQKKQLNVDLERLDKRKNEINKSIESKMFQLTEIEQEVEKLNNLIQNQSYDNHLTKLEDFISNNINSLLNFEKIKQLISNYYNQKNFDLEHEINLKLMNNLNEKLNEMRSEFYQIKNEKIVMKNNLEKAVEELNKQFNSKNCANRNKIENELKYRSLELEKITHDINLLELNCKKKETLFNKYIILLKNRCKKTKEESYYEMNPAIIIENEFEDKLKEEIIKLIEQDTKLSNEEKTKNKNIIEVYFKDLSERERILQSSFVKKKKCFADKESLNNEVSQLKELFNNIENEILSKKQATNELGHKEKVIIEKIEKRNKNLTSNLEKMGELEFENYLKSNDNVLKNMKKIYGNKVLDKVFKAQKQKFLENVILDHSYKKNKVNEYLRSIAEFESSSDFYSLRLIEIENEYQAQLKLHNAILNTRKTKIYERMVIEESKKDLKVKIEELVQKQFSEIEDEKRHLETKFNISYFMEKIKEVKQKIEASLALKNKLISEYEEFKISCEEKEQKLYREDIELKNTLVSMKTRMKSDDTIGNSKIYNNDEGRKVNENEHSNTLLSNDNANKAYVEEIQINDLMDSNAKYINTEQSGISKSINKTKKDPIISMIIDKVKPLLSGLTLYKKLNQNSSKSKPYDPLDANSTPENCGYALRSFKLNPCDEILEIYNTKNKHLENKIHMNQMKGITLAHCTKQIIKNVKDQNKKPNKQIEKVGECLPFILLYSGGSLDLVAPNYNVLEDFQIAIDELVKQKKSIYAYLKF